MNLLMKIYFAFSLLNQLNFLEIQRKDPFVLEYMNIKMTFLFRHYKDKKSSFEYS